MNELGAMVIGAAVRGTAFVCLGAVLYVVFRRRGPSAASGFATLQRRHNGGQHESGEPNDRTVRRSSMQRWLRSVCEAATRRPAYFSWRSVRSAGTLSSRFVSNGMPEGGLTCSV